MKRPFAATLEKLLLAEPSLRKKNGRLNVSAAAKAIKIQQPTLLRMLNDESEFPSPGNAKKLTKFFRISHEQLVGTSNIHQISEGKQGYDSNTLPAPSFAGRVPLISWVQAGNWAESPDIYAPGDAEEWLLQAVPNAPNCFALRVSGPSMDDGTPSGYRDGDIIHVNPAAEWKHNDDVVVRNGCGEVIFKRLVCQGDKCHLLSLHPNWPDKITPLDAHCTIIGVVVFSCRYR